MATLTSLLSPDIYTKLNKDQLNLLESALEGEILKNANIRKELEAVVPKIADDIIKSGGGGRGTRG